MGQVDCSMSKSTCNENEVRSYPSLLFLQDGIVVKKHDFFIFIFTCVLVPLSEFS